jgi:hypothetical protein
METADACEKKFDLKKKKKKDRKEDIRICASETSRRKALSLLGSEAILQGRYLRTLLEGTKNQQEGQTFMI